MTGAGVTAGPVDGAADDGGGLTGEGEGVAGVGGAAASLDVGVSRFSKKEPTDDVTASQRSRAALTPPAYPDTRRPSPVRSRNPLNSSTASRAMVRKRIGYRRGKEMMRIASVRVRGQGPIGSDRYGTSFRSAASSYRGAVAPFSSSASAIWRKLWPSLRSEALTSRNTASLSISG